MIRIVKSTDTIHVDHIAVGIYALPGLGKTTVGFTADDPLLLDFDKGAHRAKNRKDSVQIEKWSEIEGMSREDLEPYKTIVVDTVGRCLDVLAANILEQNAKAGNGAGALGLKGFGILKVRFTGWLNLMRSFGKDIVLIAHMDEKNEGDVLKERLDVQGGSKAEIYKSVDAMAKLYIENKDRKLDFSPREGSLGKNPAQLDVLVVPSYIRDPHFLGNTIRQIKDNINSRTVEQIAAAKHIEEMRERIDKLDSRDAYNEMLAQVKGDVVEVKTLLIMGAETHGLVYDRKRECFVEGA